MNDVLPASRPLPYVRRSIGVVLAILLCSAQIQCRQQPKPDSTTTGATAEKESVAPVEVAYTPPSDDGYVGSEACASCHRQIADTFRRHPMSRSILRVENDPAEAQRKNLRVPGKQRLFDVTIDDHSIVHHEKMYDNEGKLIYDFSVAMDYVVGSGRRAKAYLYQRGDLIFMSPLNWYSQSEKWDLAPGYIPDDPRRFDRRTTDACLSCHAGRIASKLRGADLYETPAFHELSVGCENCHGPGKSHVQRHSIAAHRGDAESIINPANLDPDRRESICNQCHLQVSARIPRIGRSDLDFRPGDRFEDVWSALDVERGMTEDRKTHSVNHVQQMRESRCFTQSDGRFGCTSCHDPHRVPTVEERPSFYREKCFQCHKEESCTETRTRRLEQDDSCIACHLPSRHSSNIAHVTQTDHRVRRREAAASEAATAHDDDTLTFFDHENRRLSDWERERAMGLGAWKHLSKKGQRLPKDLAIYLDRLRQRHPDDGLLLEALGSISFDHQQFKRAQDYYERARQHPDEEEAALTTLVEIYYQTRQWDQALQCADRLIAINPQLASPHALRADLLKLRGDLAGAIKAAERALELNPTLDPVRKWLIQAYREDGQTNECQMQEALLLRMQNARQPE